MGLNHSKENGGTDEEIFMKTVLTIITPVNRYLGFSAPISPVEQFNSALKKIDSADIDVRFVDPQRLHIKTSEDSLPIVCSEHGEQLKGGVYFAFGHDLLDRRMTAYVIKALELSNEKVINGYDALTIADDKALLALHLANQNIPIAKSVIASARSNSNEIINYLNSKVIISKTTGFSAGGVGVKPLPSDINFLAPDIWSARMDSKPKVIQNDLDQNNSRRQVIRSYVVGDKLIGSYTTTGYGIVNCAGLARESVARPYRATKEQERLLISAANCVKSGGYCRIDSVGGNNFAIIEVNPLARMDADAYGIDVALAILWLAVNKMKGDYEL